MNNIEIDYDLIKDMHVEANPMNTEKDMQAINFIMRQLIGISRILEVGTNVGITTCQMSINYPHAIIYTIDNMSDKYIGGCLDNFNNIIQIYGNSQCYEHVDIFDFVFIDADHSYNGVKADYINILKYIKRGSIVAFHDVCDNFRFEGINRFMKELEDHNIIINKVIDTNISYIIYNNHNELSSFVWSCQQ
jgi:predicted O-methyltransferase YrrM